MRKHILNADSATAVPVPGELDVATIASVAVTSEAVDHPVYDLLYRQPNPWQSSFEFRESMLFHLVLTGNAVVQKLRVGSQRQVASLELCEPQRTRFKRESV